jgi:hypothetical protein
MVDQTNLTTNNNANTTMAALGDKSKAKAAFAAKQKGNVDDVVNGPYTTAKKGTSATEAGTEEKFMKKTTPAGKGAAKGKVSGEEKSSGDSDPQKGPVIRQ